MKSTVKNITDFYHTYPEYIGEIKVNTRYGYKTIEYADITEYNSAVCRVKTSGGKELYCSPKHRLNINDKWVNVENININDNVLTEDGVENINLIEYKDDKEDLYDFQVKDVHEYYTNGIVSHNSTIIESIFFAIYGKTIRGLNKTDVVNKKTKKDTVVELEFEKNGNQYKIIRTLKPSGLELYENGNNVTRDSIVNTQSEIEKIFLVSEDVIKNCVIMGVNQTIPFMAQSKVEKRKFIEGIFDMTIFSEILKQARGEYNDKMKELTSLQSKRDEKNNNLVIYREQSSKFEENKLVKIDKVKTQIDEQNSELKKLESQAKDVDVSELTKLKQNKNELNDKLNLVRDEKLSSVKSSILECEINIRNSKKKIDETFTSGVCPTCKRKMSEHDEKHANEEIESLNKDIEENENKLQKFNDDLVEIQKVIKLITTKINNIDNDISDKQREINANEIILNRIKDTKNNIQRLNTSIDDIKNEVNEIDVVIKKVENELVSLDKDIDDCIKETEILDQIKFICGENGVKSYIVNKLLSIFNQKINHYLDKLNANCVLTFDEFFEEKIINDKRQECSYFNFSSGERRNIDIAIMFAFMDLQKVQGKFDTNALFFDEIVDGSLDTDGVNYVVDILLDKCNNDGKSIYLITHRKELQKHATGDIIEVVKQNGISKIINN
jgi:DNA repair exonuclease SbcCD ATPase subunit